MEFFVATDSNGDGTISADEIQFLLEDPFMSAPRRVFVFVVRFCLCFFVV